jgi:hypothetical protein
VIVLVVVVALVALVAGADSFLGVDLVLGLVALSTDPAIVGSRDHRDGNPNLEVSPFGAPTENVGGAAIPAPKPTIKADDESAEVAVGGLVFLEELIHSAHADPPLGLHCPSEQAQATRAGRPFL